MLFIRPGAVDDIRDLAAELDQLLLAPLFRKYSRFPRRIVHYTSLDALRDILESGNLRMMHYQELNDSTEMLHGRDVANKLMQAETVRHDDTSAFFDFCHFAFNDHDPGMIQYFLSSFSFLRDCPDLWCRYGAGGAGVAIAFDTRRMRSHPADNYGFHIARVTYSATEQAELLSPLVEATKQILRRYVTKHGYDVRDAAIQVLAAKLCSHFAHHSIALKDESWGVEEEWRTVFSLLSNDEADRQARVETRADGRRFVDVRVCSEHPADPLMPIISVTVGPRGNPADVGQILVATGYPNVIVATSACSSAEIEHSPTAG